MQYTVEQCKSMLRKEVWEKFFCKNAENFLNIHI